HFTPSAERPQVYRLGRGRDPGGSVELGDSVDAVGIVLHERIERTRRRVAHPSQEGAELQRELAASSHLQVPHLGLGCRHHALFEPFDVSGEIPALLTGSWAPRLLAADTGRREKS